MIGIIISLVILGLVIWAMHYVASQFQRVAREKGWDERKFYWLSFLMGSAGWLLVIALPDRNAPAVVAAPASAKQVISDELPPL